MGGHRAGVGGRLTADALRRVLEVAVLVLVWMALGRAFDLGTSAYLVLGIPLTVAFQLGVRRRPLRTMWVRDSQSFRLTPTEWAVAGGLAFLPVVIGIGGLLRHHWTDALWGFAGAGGAVPAAFALGRAAGTGRTTLRTLAFAFPLPLVVFIVGAVSRQTFVSIALVEIPFQTLIYLPITFALEEVTFRGVIDDHIRDMPTFISAALWGLWHLPIASHRTPAVLGGLLVFQVVVGIPLALGWRRTGNLVVPGFVHALLDAVRNALLQ